MSIYAIGDIHGMLGALKTIFAQNMIRREDLVVFLGDYIDRGPESSGTINWLIEKAADYHFIFLMGNHDIMMLEARADRQQFIEWFNAGGAETLNSYGIEDGEDWPAKIPSEHWDFLDRGLPYFIWGEFIFVHAGLEPGKRLRDQDDFHLFWKKYQSPESYSKDLRVICGHTSRKNGQIVDYGHTICIDTFAYGGQWLTCLNVQERTFIKAKADGTVLAGELRTMV